MATHYMEIVKAVVLAHFYTSSTSCPEICQLVGSEQNVFFPKQKKEKYVRNNTNRQRAIVVHSFHYWNLAILPVYHNIFKGISAMISKIITGTGSMVVDPDTG
jgi:hypothetical protein